MPPTSSRRSPRTGRPPNPCARSTGSPRARGRISPGPANPGLPSLGSPSLGSPRPQLSAWDRSAGSPWARGPPRAPTRTPASSRRSFAARTPSRESRSSAAGSSRSWPSWPAPPQRQARPSRGPAPTTRTKPVRSYARVRGRAVQPSPHHRATGRPHPRRPPPTRARRRPVPPPPRHPRAALPRPTARAQRPRLRLRRLSRPRRPNRPLPWPLRRPGRNHITPPRRVTGTRPVLEDPAGRATDPPGERRPGALGRTLGTLSGERRRTTKVDLTHQGDAVTATAQ
jgi:hypothetical protein